MDAVVGLYAYVVLKGQGDKMKLVHVALARRPCQEFKAAWPGEGLRVRRVKLKLFQS